MSDSIAPGQDRQTRGLVITSWSLIGAVCLISMIPFFGFGSWLIAGPVLFVVLVLGIIILTRGGTLPGVCILLTSLIAAPIFVAVAPFVSSLLGVAGAGAALSTADNKPATRYTETISDRTTPSPRANETRERVPQEPDYESLRDQLQHQLEPIANLKAKQLVSEGDRGFLVGTDQLTLEQRRIVQQENVWREKMFELIAKRTSQPVEVVAGTFARLAGASATTPRLPSND